jgi:putative heme-binding domain-containing protein
MRTLTVFCLAAALPLFAQHEKEVDKSKFIGDLKAIEAGRVLFANGCAACHGPDGRGGRGPNLREKIFWHPVDDETLYKAIEKGISGGMPPANLPVDQMWQVVAFVRSLTAPAMDNVTPGDAKAGEELFWGKAGCGGCHRIQGRGGSLGPDLSNAGATRAVPQLRDAILDPDSEISAGYESVSISLKNGKTLRGVARNRTNYSMQFQEADGNLHLLSMNDIAKVTVTKGSQMPKDFAKRLSKGDVDNLISYLARQSLRPPDAPKGQEK